MSVISRKFEAKASSTQLTSIAGAEKFFSVEPDMELFEGCHVQVSVTFTGSPTDNMLVNVYSSLTDSPSYDVVPFMTFVIDKDTSPSTISFIVKDVFQFKVGVIRQGSTDTHTDADMDTRLFRYEVI